MRYITPLRYPGGKSKLSPFIKALLEYNDLVGGRYVEPYAGGAGVALDLLFSDYVDHIYINDLSRSVYSFWWSLLEDTENLCALIHNTPITMESWHRQKHIQLNPLDCSTLELGFSTFFLNRTNRSGIIHSGGVVGGKSQQGTWHLDARYNKTNLVARIEAIANKKARISIYNCDAGEFIETFKSWLPENSLVYLDPPYYSKSRRLYDNNYQPADHAIIREKVRQMDQRWMVSYDNHPEVLALYQEFRHMSIQLSYTANNRSVGSEVVFFSEELDIPSYSSPTKFRIISQQL